MSPIHRLEAHEIPPITKWEAFKEKMIDLKPAWVYRMEDKIRDFVYGRFIRRHWQIRTSLPKQSWIDCDTRLMYGMMQVLKEFYEKEISQNIVDWSSDPDHQHARDEMEVIYRWWINYPNRLRENSDCLSAWSDRIEEHMKSRSSDETWRFLEYLNLPESEKNPVERELSKKHDELEEKLHNEEKEMMLRLVNIRDYLWT